MKKLFPFFLSSLLLLINFTVSDAIAETMSNDDYIIRMGNFNMLSGHPTGEDYSVSFTAGQTGPGLYGPSTGANYKVRAGFQYIYSIVPFSFTIENTSINFGTLTPGNPVTRDSTLTVSNQSAGGYSVVAFENHQLLVPVSGTLIPDTTCDTGGCSETTPANWTSNLTYGFGYRCDSVDATNYCSTDFTDTDNYKQFADLSNNESAQMIFSNTTGSNQRAKVTYKVNISASQPPGLYTNVITYIATPTY